MIKKIIYQLIPRRTSAKMVYLGVALLVSNATYAQFRDYAKVFSDNIKGGTTLFGNTLAHVITYDRVDTFKMNNNRANGNSAYGNDNANMQYIDVDGNTGAGTETRNSSSADLSLPEGENTIKLARLYWGGNVNTADFNLSENNSRNVKIRYGSGGAYTKYAATQLDKNSIAYGTAVFNQYQAYVDITPFIQTNGSGTYTVGDIAASVGAVDNGGNYAGWCIVVVYENLNASSYNSVRVYDGFQQVNNGGSVQVSSVTLTGLNVPSGTMNGRDAKMSAMVWEGDAKYNQDYLKINGNSFYNGLNAIDNLWNGTISDTGKHVSNKNPDYTNQMGIDIDQFFVGSGYGIKPGDTTVSLEFGTKSDRYFPGLFTFQIKTNDPMLMIDKLVKDANNNHIAEIGEVLTYTLKGKNAGQGNANFCVVMDTLPKSVSYVPGSVKLISGAGMEPNRVVTDTGNDDQLDFISAENVLVFRLGNGANGLQGGVLGYQESFEVTFEVTVNNPGANGHVPPIINKAGITAFSDAGAKSTDEGTAILEPMGGPLPVTLQTFSAHLSSMNTVKLQWTTTMEINCRSYSIERSTDGKTFINTGTIAGAGNTSIQKNYFFNDDIITVKTNIVYYRLKQTDTDGRNNYSATISVRLKTDVNGFSVSPNPFSSYVTLQINWSKNEKAIVKVISMNGKELVSKNIQLLRGINYISLNQLSPFPSGVYIIQVNSYKESIVKQLSKQ